MVVYAAQPFHQEIASSFTFSLYSANAASAPTADSVLGIAKENTEYSTGKSPSYS